MKKRYELLVFDLQGTLVNQGCFLDGSLDLLRSLKSRGYWLAAATNWGQSGLERILSALPSDLAFDAVRSASMAHSKPHPQMLWEILDELGVDASSALMVGDTVLDIQFGKNAGVDVLAVSYGEQPRMVLLNEKPLDCVDSVQALKDWLDTL